jgi:membrane protease YdiL (CAAX protease family)
MEIQEQKRLPWHPLLAVVFAVVLYYAASFIASFILVVVFLVAGWDIDRITNELTVPPVPVQFTFYLLVEAFTVGCLVGFLKLYKVSIKAIGFVKPKLIHIGAGLAAYPLYFVVYFILVTLTAVLIPGFNAEQEQQLGFDNVTGVLPLLLTFISLVVLPPLAEELLFRGFLFSSFRSRVGFWLSAICTSFLFAIAHLQEGGSSGLLFVAALDTFVLSLFLCFLREKTGNLWAGITLHALKNFVAFLSLFILATH